MAWNALAKRIYSRLLRGLGAGPVTQATTRDPLGPEGERVAAAMLKKKKYTVVGCNLRVPMGEADILCIAPDGVTIVLVEVKARRVAPGQTQPLHAPEASVTHAKREKLVKILRHLAKANAWHDRPLRIDVVGIEFPDALSQGEPLIRHHEEAIVVSRGDRRSEAEKPKP